MSELDSFPGHLIRRLHQKSVAAYMSHTGDIDVTQVQFAALSALDTSPGVDQAKLGALIALDKVTTGEIVSRLVKKGLILREVRATDRRSFELYLTTEGTTVLKRLRLVTRKAQNDLLSPLSKAERETLLNLVKKLVLGSDA
jgi:DNA-binding MarR family transcriptional regulator